MFNLKTVTLRLYQISLPIMLCLFFVANAHAVMFNQCIPDDHVWSFISDPQAQAFFKQREQLRCDTENAILDSWKTRIITLERANDSIKAAFDRSDWKAIASTWSSTKQTLSEIQQSVLDNPEIARSQPLPSIFSQNLNYFFQNVGFPAPSSFDEAFMKIETAATTPTQHSQAVTLATSILNQVISRSTEFAIALSRAEGKAVRAQTDAIREQRRKAKADKLNGRTVEGYFGGFVERISVIWKPWLTMLMVVAFLAGWVGIKRRVNPIVAATAASGAYLIPGVIMVVALVILPFLPFWFIFPATLGATFAVFLHAGQIYNGLADRLKSDSKFAYYLRVTGKTIDILRSQLSNTNQSDVVSNMITDKATHGTSRWGTVGELHRNNHLYSLDNPPEQAGFALARVHNAPKQFDQRFRHVGHVVTVAPSGSGKGIGAVIPNLLEYPGSCLVLDVKGENSAVTARARLEMGHQVYQTDPFGLNNTHSARFNVLDRLDINHADCVSESAVLADSLVVSEAKSKDDHFDESAKTLLQGLILHVVAEKEPQHRNLGEVRRLLTTDEETLLTTLAEMASGEATAFGLPARAANTLMSMGDRERGSVLSTARRHTAFLDDPRIADALSYSDFDLTKIKSDPMTIYLILPANKIVTNARFVRLFISSVISAITESSQQPRHRVAFILDEFSQLGYMKQIEDAVSLMRGYGLAFWVFLQDLSQLKNVYPRWQTFLANSAKTFFGTDDYDTAKYISDSLGQATIEYSTESTGSNRGLGFSTGGASSNQGKSSGLSQKLDRRLLMTPDEVMRLGPEHPIVFIKGEYPYQLDRINYLFDPEYIGKFDPNPYHD